MTMLKGETRRNWVYCGTAGGQRKKDKDKKVISKINDFRETVNKCTAHAIKNKTAGFY